MRIRLLCLRILEHLSQVSIHYKSVLATFPHELACYHNHLELHKCPTGLVFFSIVSLKQNLVSAMNTASTIVSQHSGFILISQPFLSVTQRTTQPVMTSQHNSILHVVVETLHSSTFLLSIAG